MDIEDFIKIEEGQFPDIEPNEFPLHFYNQDSVEEEGRPDLSIE